MTYSLFITMEVTDFDEWLNPDPSVPEGLFRDAGATYERLTRHVDDPNLITIEGRFPTEDAALAFDDLGRAADNFDGKPGGRYDSWIGEAVEGYEFDLAG